MSTYQNPTAPTKADYNVFSRRVKAQLRRVPALTDKADDDLKITLLAITGHSTIRDIPDLGKAEKKVTAYVEERLAENGAADTEPQPATNVRAWYLTAAAEADDFGSYVSGESVATDWLVSVTPKQSGDLETPCGKRFCLTVHNGATADEVIYTVAAMCEALDRLAEYGVKPATRNGHEVARQPDRKTAPKNTPKRTSQHPTRQAPANGDTTYNVYGVGECIAGREYRVHIAFARAGATVGNSPIIELYRQEDKFAFLRVFERQFDLFREQTGIEGATMRPGIDYGLESDVVFRLATDQSGKVKTTGKGNPYLDFVRVEITEPEPGEA